jgi:hypothetical protein
MTEALPVSTAPSKVGATRIRESDLGFEFGGPAYRLMQRLGIIEGAGPSVLRRSVVFIAVTWIPLLVFAAVEGHALGPTPRTSLLLDFATYARIFVGVPLIFAAELVVGPRMRNAGLRLLDANIVRAESRAQFEAAVERVKRRREAYLPEIIFLIVALIGARVFTLDQLTGTGATTWHTTWAGGQLRLSASGLWYGFVVVPLVQFFVLRWVWRLVIWTLFLWDVSRLRLNLFATHTDMAAGLGFLGMTHVSMAIFPFTVGCVMAAEISFRAQFESLDLATLQAMLPILIAYLAFVEFVTFGPLLIFVPLLARTRREALASYGGLVQHHNELFHRKWIDGARSRDELPLGNPDMSSLVDLGSSYMVVRDMRIVPFNFAQIGQVAVISCLPGLPLLFQMLPLVEALKVLARVVV